MLKRSPTGGNHTRRAANSKYNRIGALFAGSTISAKAGRIEKIVSNITLGRTGAMVAK